jgi:hypothetical protein
MAKQSLNVGSLANDGTGDSLRSGATKINANYTEIYSAIGNGSALTVNVTGAQQGQVLRWNGSNFIAQDYGSLTSTLDVNNYKIISSENGNINLDPQGTGDVILEYGGQTATFDGLTGQAQFSNSISYKNEYALIANAPLLASHKGYFFTVAGSDTPKVHMAVSGVGDVTANILTNYSSVNLLSDVDTATVAPVTGEVLKWNGTNWTPQADAAGASTQNIFLTIAGDSGSTTANSPTDSLTISGGTNCSTVVTGDVVTVNVDGSFQFSTLSDVSFTSLSRGQSISYNTAGAGAWNNYPSPTLWYIFSTGLNNASYLVEGPGQVQADDADLHLYRGFTYVFVNQAGPNHPLRIQSTQGLGGSAFTLGVSGSQTGTQIFTVPHSAPNTLYYQCTVHANMAGILYIK